MRTAIVACIALLIGLVLGWSIKEKPAMITRYVYRDVLPISPPSKPSSTSFPQMPKPPIEMAKPVEEMFTSQAPIPAPLDGKIPRLPIAGVSGPVGPLTPISPTALPLADLNADEALARRIVLAMGGDIVSSGDAKDSSGKIGRALVAEAENGSPSRIEDSLRRSLGDRIILNDGGIVEGANPETRKAEDALLALRKQRDQARLDFLPNAPTLLDLEDSYRKQERALADLRKSSSRQRLNILIRPVLGQ